MPGLPTVVGLVLCETLAVEPQNARLSLVGVFHTRHFPRFPTPPQKFTVYAALHNGAGEGTLELMVSRLETEQDIHRYQRWLAFPGGGVTINQEIKLRKCVFPAPGTYSFSLRFDGHQLSQRYLRVYRGEG